MHIFDAFELNPIPLKFNRISLKRGNSNESMCEKFALVLILKVQDREFHASKRNRLEACYKYDSELLENRKRL